MPRRKSKSLYDVTPALLKKVEKLAGSGLQNNQIAASIGWAEATYYKRKAESQEFAEAIKKGESKGVQKVVNALAKRALGFSVTEVHKEISEGPSGTQKKQKSVEKNFAPDTTAIIFYLTNRDPENWKHKSEQTINGSVPVAVISISKKDAKKVKEIFDEITE